MNKNIYFFLDVCEGGGIERFISNLSYANIDGYDIKVISFYKPRIWLQLSRDTSFEYLFDGKKRNLKTKEKEELINKLKSKISDEDIVIANHSKSIKILKKVGRGKLIYVVHGVANSYLNGFLNRSWFLYKLKNKVKDVKVVCVSTGLEGLINRISPKTITKTIHNPISLESVVNRANEEGVNYENYYLFAGRLAEEKQVDKIIDSFSYHMGNNQEKLIIIGDGPCRVDLEQQVEELKLKDKVLFLGHRDNPYPFIKNAKCLVLGSKCEGFPYVLLEALALNTAIISTDCDFGPRDTLIGWNRKFLIKKESDIFNNHNIESFSFNEYDLSELEINKVLSRYINFAYS